ncbi:hypothetical protein GQ457_01G015050 [Hibiscus cannabinus]
MSNPTELSGVNTTPTTGPHGGRSPDAIPSPICLSMLERHGSPISEEKQPAIKRVRCEVESELNDVVDREHMDEYFDTTMRGTEICNLSTNDQVHAENLWEEPKQIENGDSKVKLSFRDTLMGKGTMQSPNLTISELDVTIRFSDRVHDAIDEKLANSVIIRLLGKSIGYRALLNRIQALWNPIGELQLIDMDNEYILVRFANEEDFIKVLSGGSWVVYGSYLTVQPWSRHFSTNADHPDKVMVWVRLSKLPYHYYTKSLFRYIVNSIGKVVRIDYNTEDGKRGRFARLAVIIDLHKPLVSSIIIDGLRQDIEYEGLPTIYFTCGKYGHSKEDCGIKRKEGGSTIADAETRNPKDLYGPWMQVTNRRKKTFIALQEIQDEETNVNYAEPITLTQQPKDVSSHKQTMAHRSKEHVVILKNKQSCSITPQQHEEEIIDLDVDPSEGQNTIAGGLEMNMPKEVATNERIIRYDTSLNKDKHTTVKLGNKIEAHGSKVRNVRVLPASIRNGSSKIKTKTPVGLKGVQRQGNKTKMKDDRGSMKPSLVASVSALISDLDKAKNADITRHMDEIQHSEEVQWRGNSIYEQPRSSYG